MTGTVGNEASAAVRTICFILVWTTMYAVLGTIAGGVPAPRPLQYECSHGARGPELASLAAWDVEERR